MSSKINLQTCEYACKSSIFQDNQLILPKDKAIIKDINEVFGTEENTKFGGKDFLIKSIKLENGFVLTAFVNQSTFLVGIKSILITTLIFLLICLFFQHCWHWRFPTRLQKG